MADVGGVITSQVDLLWSVALAMLLAEVYLIGRFLEGGAALPKCLGSRLLLFSSLFLQLVSMLCGYLTYGAIVTMTRCAPSNGGEVDEWCVRNDMTQAGAFAKAELMSLLQFGAFGLGLIFFIVLFVKEPRAVAAAFKKP